MGTRFGLCLFIVFTLYVVIQMLSCVQLFATPWASAHQVFLSFTISLSLLKLKSIELVMSSNHLILYLLSPLAFNLSQQQGLFSESDPCIRWPKYWSFSFSISPSNECSGLISFRIDRFDPLAFQGTLNSLFHITIQKHQFFSAVFLMVQLSHLYITTRKTIVLFIWTLSVGLLLKCYRKGEKRKNKSE